MTIGTTRSSPPRRVARHVQPELTEARLARQWSGVQARVGSPRRRLPLALALAGVAVGALIAVLVVRAIGRSPASVWVEGTVLESGEGSALVLPDGSRVALDRSTRVRLAALRADEAHLIVERGGVDVDVMHVGGRRFVVSTDRFDIVDVGTRFHVSVGADGATHVLVERGRVEVRPRGASGTPRVLDAGDSWSSAPAETGPTETGPPTAAIATAAFAVPSAAASAPDVPAAPGSDSAGPPPDPSTGRLAAAGPKELLELAQDARLHGRPRDAAAAFDGLRRRFRGDPRAGLAAFELGRLRLDSFGEPASALEAFDDAIALSPGAPFREDAEARRVDALERMHATGRCVAARDAYLAAHPAGVHAATMASRCGVR
jgi:transmembrane sensor